MTARRLDGSAPSGPRVLIIVYVCAAIYAAVCLAAYLAQASLVFFPGPPPRATPAAAGLAFDDVELATRDGERLHGWLVRPKAAHEALVLVCHGNAGNIEDRLHLASAFVQMGHAVLLFDFRGYGGSSGRPSEEGLYADAECAYDCAVHTLGFAPAQIVAYGESLGGAVAIELARRREVAALVVEEAFTSLPDVGAIHYRWLPVRWLSRYRFDSIAKVPAIDAPTLVIHSPDDEIVPFEQGRALFEAARAPKRFLATAGSHNAGGFTQRVEWRGEVQSWIARARRGSRTVAPGAYPEPR
jgi:fermentation-respiration switch protein FrsA (DUF1100 family)